MSDREPDERWIADMDRIDWAAIEHAYGPAADVPEMIRSVVRGGDDAIQACGELSNNLNHQGSIYPATGPAVPFLIEALRATAAGPRVRVGLLGVLGGIAGGAAAWIDNDSTGTSGEDGISFRDVFAAVWRGAELYAQLLANDPDADVRMHAAHVTGVLLGAGPALAPDNEVGFGESVGVLLERVGVEEDGQALSSIAFALGGCVPHDPRARESLRELFGRPGADEAVRVAAALGLVETDGAGREEVGAADVLINVMSRAPETDRLFQPRTGPGDDSVRWSPWVWGRLRFRLCRALCAWSTGDEGRMRRVLPALLVGVRAATGYTAEADIGPVLQWLWPGRGIRFRPGKDGRPERELPPAVTPDELTEIRQAVVEACHASPGVWTPLVGNTELAFMRVGLPVTRAGLGKLLGID